MARTVLGVAGPILTYLGSRPGRAELHLIEMPPDEYQLANPNLRYSASGEGTALQST